MGNIGVLLVGMQNQLPDIVKRESQASVQAAFLFQPSLNQPHIDHFANQRGSGHADSGGDNLLFHFPRYFFGQRIINIGFPNEGVNNTLTVPGRAFFRRCADK